MRQTEFYTLRQVANLTGLSEFTLRGWEGRYQAFEPGRTETGRRKYSKTDLKRALILRQLTNQGHRISEIAQLSNHLLEKKLDGAKSLSVIPQLRDDIPSKTVEALLKLTVLQDWDKLKKTLSLSLAKTNPLIAIEKIVLPVLAQVGIYVAQDRFGIAQEHILSSLLKEQLYAMLTKISTKEKTQSKFSVIIATPEGDYHEMGILIAHVIFNFVGVKSLFLGTNTPKNDLCQTTLRFGATHILLASTISRQHGTGEDIFSYVDYLDQHLPNSVELWFGGRNLEKSNFNLSRNFKFFNDLLLLPGSIDDHLDSK